MISDYGKCLKRSVSFFGVHFDFHASEADKNIGENTSREMIEKLVKEVRPDYVQCDSKGHRGLSSYPTDVGNPAPGITKDALVIWREVTLAHGVALYLHYSGVWDNEALKWHPSWARVNEKGKRDKRITSTFGAYADELLIPQLKELYDRYGVDGVWIDGECWATCHDYGKKVKAAFREETGIQDTPARPADLYYYEFSQFCREGFRRYLRHYVHELHKKCPGLQIASNWAFTSLMPEKVSADVDFISGDYTPSNSVNAARLEARCMAKQNKPWDLMSWSFNFRNGENDYSTKSAEQLKREAAIVLSLGGGFQLYFRQKRDGSIREWQIEIMKEVAQFCRARQSICHKAEPVPQIGLLYSSASFYRKNTNLFGQGNGILEPMQGILQCLLQSQLSVEILMEHHLTGHMQEYPLIIIPEWEYLEPGFISQLSSYVENGGNLLVIGPAAAKIFEKELGIAFDDEKSGDCLKWLEHKDMLACIGKCFQAVTVNQARQFGKIYNDEDITGSSQPAASINSYGKGKIAAVYFNMGLQYYKASNHVIRNFIHGIVKELFPEPMVEVAGSSFVDLAVNRMGGKLAINLVNTAGPHDSSQTCVFDEIPAVGPLTVTVRGANKSRMIRLFPGGEEMTYTIRGDELIIQVPLLRIHSIIEITQI
jgi:hypothetical protein